MKRKFIIILLIFLFPLSGCAQRIKVKDITSGTSLVSLEENVLIFGHIRWFENGEKKERSMSLQILRVEDMKTGSITIEKDGSFFTLIPMGTYIIHQLNWFDPWDGQHWIVPKTAFQVVEGQHYYYLGSLVVDVKAKRDIIGGLWIKGVRVHIEDEEDNSMKAFQKRYPDQEVKASKALMKHDPSIPRIDELERQSVLGDVLRALQFGLMPSLYP